MALLILKEFLIVVLISLIFLLLVSLWFQAGKLLRPFFSNATFSGHTPPDPKLHLLEKYLNSLSSRLSGKTRPFDLSELKDLGSTLSAIELSLKSRVDLIQANLAAPSSRNITPDVGFNRLLKFQISELKSLIQLGISEKRPGLHKKKKHHCYFCSRPISQATENKAKIIEDEESKSVASCVFCSYSLERNKKAHVLKFLWKGESTHWSKIPDYKPSKEYWHLNFKQNSTETKPSHPPEKIPKLRLIKPDPHSQS